MRPFEISSIAVLVLASPAAVARDRQEAAPVHDDASLNAAMLEYRFSLEEFAWYNPYMTGESAMDGAPARMEETGAASGEPAAAPSTRADDEGQRQFLDHVWSDP